MTRSDMVHQPRYVVEDYILHKIRLKFSNGMDLVPLATRKGHRENQQHSNNISVPQPKPSELNIAVRKIAEEYERRYEENFPDLFEQIQKSNVSTRDVNLVLTKISKDLFNISAKGEGNHIKWGHVIALLVFGGILAVRAVELSYTEEVDEIVRWISVFIDTELANWLERQGGWNNLFEWTKATNSNLIYENGRSFDTSNLSSGLRSIMSVGVLAACVSIGAMMMARK